VPTDSAAGESLTRSKAVSDTVSFPPSRNDNGEPSLALGYRCRAAALSNGPCGLLAASHTDAVVAEV
jgi:hypothetical protein